MARPSKLTPEREKAIMTAVAAGATLAHAARAAGVNLDTFYSWTKRNAPFAEALKAAESRGVLTCLANIHQAAKKGNWQAAAWILERRHPNDYGRRERVDLHHEGALDVRVLANFRSAILAAVGDDPAARQRIGDALATLDEAEVSRGPQH